MNLVFKGETKVGKRESTILSCPVHKGYRGVGKPRSTKGACTCKEIYAELQWVWARGEKVEKK